MTDKITISEDLWARLAGDRRAGQVTLTVVDRNECFDTLTVQADAPAPSAELEASRPPT